LNSKKKKESDYEIVKEILTEQELIVDSYEQVRERPGDNKEQEKYYSGKGVIIHLNSNDYLTIWQRYC